MNSGNRLLLVLCIVLYGCADLSAQTRTQTSLTNEAPLLTSELNRALINYDLIQIDQEANNVRIRSAAVGTDVFTLNSSAEGQFNMIVEEVNLQHSNFVVRQSNGQALTIDPQL